MHRPLVDTSKVPPDARTTPFTTRNPFPKAPRVGSRFTFEEINGRLMENSSAISSGVPAIPGPSSSTKNPSDSNLPMRHVARSSKELSANSFATRRRSRSGSTPDFCEIVCSVRNIVQSSRTYRLAAGSITSLFARCVTACTPLSRTQSATRSGPEFHLAEAFHRPAQEPLRISQDAASVGLWAPWFNLLAR